MTLSNDELKIAIEDTIKHIDNNAPLRIMFTEHLEKLLQEQVIRLERPPAYTGGGINLDPFRRDNLI